MMHPAYAEKRVYLYYCYVPQCHSMYTLQQAEANKQHPKNKIATSRGKDVNILRAGLPAAVFPAQG